MRFRKLRKVIGYYLPVSAFNGYEDGTMDSGTAAYEKRYIASFVLEWIEKTLLFHQK